MAKIFNGKVLFASAMQPTGAQPLDDRVVVQSYSDLIDSTTFGDAKYLGMIVGVVDDSKVYMLTNTDVAVEGAWKEIGAGGAVSVETYAEAVALATDENIGQVIYVKTKSSYDADGEGEGAAIEYDAAPYIVIGEGSLQKLAASTASGNIEGDVAELTTKVSELETAVEGKAEASDVYTKTAADEAFAAKSIETKVSSLENDLDSLQTTVDEIDLSLYVTEDHAAQTYVRKEGYVAYSDAEKTKLAGIAEGAEVNYIKSVGANLSVSDAGELTVTIPEASVKGVVADDPVLKLDSDGLLSTSISFERGEDEYGNDSLLLKGDGDQILGRVPVSDFIADGMLKSVEPIEGTNKFKFTFNTDENADGSSDSFEVDFSKYVDTYHADGTTIELGADNTFNVKAGVFEAAGEAAKVQGALDEYIGTNDAAIDALSVKLGDYYTKTEAEGKFADVAHAITDDERAKLANIAENAQVNVIETVTVDGVELTPKNKTVNIDLSAKVDKVENHALVKNDLITKLEGLAAINSVGENLSIVENELQVDLSNLVVKVDGKDLSTNDFTNDLKTKLEGIAVGAEVNVVKSVDTTGALNLSEAGELSIDLGAYATTEAMNNALAAKLDVSAKVNGVSFVDGEATLDAGDIALEAAITRTGEGGEVENVYAAEVSIQSVLASLSQRIDVLDPNVSGELGITSIVEGNGVKVETSGGQATISVKASAVEGNMAEVKTDGVYVQDMRSYWEAI